MMAGPQHMQQLHHLQQYHSQDRVPSPTTLKPLPPSFVRHKIRPLSPVASVNGVSSDDEHELLEQLASSDASGTMLTDLHTYPIRARVREFDPLAKGLATLGPDLDRTLLPILQLPIPKGPDNIGIPHCHGVKGVGGSMVNVAPIENVYAAIRNTQIERQRQQVSGQAQQPTADGLQRGQEQQQQQQHHQHHQHHHHHQQPPPVQQLHERRLQRAPWPVMTQRSSPPHAMSSQTPSPPSGRSSIQQGLPRPLSSKPSNQPTWQSQATAMAPKQLKNEPQEGPQEEFKTEFRFVVNEDAKTARNTVRQHVMREYRRRERWEQGKNKVTKAKKPAKKESKDQAKGAEKDVSAGEEGQPTAVTRARDTPSFDGSTVVDDVSTDGSHRRDSQTMSLSDDSEASAPETDQFSAILGARTLAHKRPQAASQPFAPYVGNGIDLKPEDVEEAVEEIERSEFAFMPYKHDPWAEIARAEINPFSSQVTVGAGPASRALLHHYAWVMPSLMDEIVTGNVFHRIGWLYSAVAVHDPTPYHTIMGFTLGHVAMLRGMDEPAMATEHKEKSLRLIHNRLANPLVAASDGSIGAIANIAAYELIDCRPERFAIHMQGLSRLVSQRGGMSDFSLNPELETVLVRLDVIRAYVTISAPRFPAWTAVRKLTPLAVNIGPPSTEWFCAPAEHHQHSYLYSEDAIRLMHNVEDIMLLMRSVNPTIPFTPDPSFKVLLMDSILTHLRCDMMETPRNFSSHVSRRVIRLAAIVLFDIAAAEFFNPPSAGEPTAAGGGSQAVVPIPRPVVKEVGSTSSQDGPERKAGSIQAPKDKKGMGQARLRHRFPAIEHSRSQWGRSVEMMLAVLMQAERMAMERPFRAWYVADIVTMTMKLGDEEWVAVGEALKADLIRRVVEERGLKEERRRNGIEDDGVWDLEELLTRFWQEWSV